jgi:acylglycerol lipase
MVGIITVSFLPFPCSGKSDTDLYFTVHAEPGDDKLDFANHVSAWVLQRSGSEDSKSKL